MQYLSAWTYFNWDSEKKAKDLYESVSHKAPCHMQTLSGYD